MRPSFLAWVSTAFLLLVVLTGCGGSTGPLPDSSPSLDEVDTRAAAFAADLLAGSDSTHDTLTEALLAAGFTIRPEFTPSTLTTQDSLAGMGIAFEAFDVEVLAAATDEGTALGLNDLVFALSQVFDEYPDADFGSFILDGIRQGAQSENASLRTWARLIVEIGKQGPGGYDLLADVDLESVQLSTLQATLIGYRLLADAYLATMPEVSPAHLQTALRPTSEGCTPQGIEAIIMDVSAAGLTKAHGQLIAYLQSKNVQGAEQAGKLLGRVNLALAYIKLAWTVIAFESDLQMPHGPELLRTKSDQYPGETEGFVYTARFEIPQSKWVNCFRLMLNVAGLDFSLPDQGAIKGASVQWKILQGSGLNGSELLVQFPLGAKPHQTTNDSGSSIMMVEGRPQPIALSASAEQVRKPASIGADVSLTPANMFKDLLDATGASLATLPADLFMRTRWLFNDALPFTVVDWEEPELCKQTLSRVENQSQPGSACVGGSTYTWTRIIPADSSMWTEDVRESFTSTAVDMEFVLDAEWPNSMERVFRITKGTVTLEGTMEFLESGCTIAWGPVTKVLYAPDETNIENVMGFVTEQLQDYGEQPAGSYWGSAGGYILTPYTTTAACSDNGEIETGEMYRTAHIFDIPYPPHGPVFMIESGGVMHGEYATEIPETQFSSWNQWNISIPGAGGQ